MAHRKSTLLAITLLSFSAACTSAQTPLEFTPYRIDVFVALRNPADMNTNAQQHLAHRLEQLAQAHVGAPWALDVQVASGALLAELLLDGTAPSSERLLELTPDNTQRDKAMYVVLTKDRSRWSITIRELDFITFRLSPAAVRSDVPHPRLAEEVLEGVSSLFSPVVKLESAGRDTVTGAVKASGLIVDPDSPAALKQGEPLLGIIRHDDRLGRAKPSDVLEIPWTVLEVLPIKGRQITMQVHSAHRRPLGGKTRLRLTRYAQTARFAPQSVELTLKTPAQHPLIGYEVVTRDIESGEPILLATTGENGMATLPQPNAPWQLLYIRHGDRVLARLPFVSGVSKTQTVQLPSDDVRHAAEGFIAAFRQEIVDTVSRRQILASRIRRLIAAGEFNGAQLLLEQMRGLDSAADFSRRLSEAKSTYQADNARGQQLIDEMFADTQGVLERYLSAAELDALARQLAAARAEG